ncbi:DddA-like double-stranded DNA deaminase toxin [Lentzea sp. JNUCC 0626]|uniref:DddA-like double-stranded DNA deaminase toxin n=1 Tax=Lentzea sp. JNUCC 0626 TaxID=3367513 RepID=UPI0037493169
MATFEEIAAGLDRVVSKADEANAALAQAGELADEAAALLAEVMQGSGSLEYEFDQVMQAWLSVATGAVELSEIVAAGCRTVEEYRRTLQGDAPTQPPAQPSQPSPAPARGSPSASPPMPPNADWIEQQRAALPTYVTSGFFRDDDGHSDLVQSGDAASAEVRAIAKHVADLGLIRPGSTPWVASHVEAKVAWRMREATVQHVRHAEVVINNVICRGELGCDELLPDILLPGQTLVVHDPKGSHTFRGRDIT